MSKRLRLAGSGSQAEYETPSTASASGALVTSNQSDAETREEETTQEIPDWAAFIQEVRMLSNKVETLSNKVETMSNKVETLSNQCQADRCVTRPYLDNFYERLHVQQGTGCGTYSFMKLKNQPEKVVAITSAHLLDKFRKPNDEDYIFLMLPQAICKIGVKKVLLHQRILDNENNKNIAHADLMLVELKSLPREYKMEDLENYPDESIPYEDKWRSMDVIGRSQRDFVTGRSITENQQNPKEKHFHYEFLPESGEPGDSGTLMFAIDKNGNKNFVGVYKGDSRRKRSKSGDLVLNPRGYITPAIGWKNLEEIAVCTNIGQGSAGLSLKVETKNGVAKALSYENTIGEGTHNFQCDEKTFCGTVIHVPGTNLRFTSRDNSYSSVQVHDDESSDHHFYLSDDQDDDVSWNNGIECPDDESEWGMQSFS